MTVEVVGKVDLTPNKDKKYKCRVCGAIAPLLHSCTYELRKQKSTLRGENARLKAYINILLDNIRNLTKGARYEHYKGDNYTGICKSVQHTETGEELVVYMGTTGDYWARPKEMFNEEVAPGIPRFLIHPSPRPVRTKNIIKR